MPRVWRSIMRLPRRRVGVPVTVLRPLDGLEERAEVAVAEALVAASLDELVEKGTRPLVAVEARRFAQEDLEHVFVVLAVDEYLEVLELGEIVRDVLDAELRQALGHQAIVVLVRRQKGDAAGAELAHGRDDVG